MVLCSYLNCLSFSKTWIFLRSKKVFPSCFVCFALLISQLTKLFLPFDWKDLISRLLSKSRFVFVLSICFFILNLCFIRFSMSTNSHLSLVRGCTRNRTPTSASPSSKRMSRRLIACASQVRPPFFHMGFHPMHILYFFKRGTACLL